MTTKRPKSQYDHIAEQIAAVRPFARFAGIFLPQVRRHWAELAQQIAKVDRDLMNVDLFSKRYSSFGWSNYDRMATPVLERLRDVSVEEGEAILTAYHLAPATLEILGYRFLSEQFKPWYPLYQRAIERCEVKDWLSAVPLLLIIVDGICTVTTGKHPFSGGADAVVFDCMASNEGGLGDSLRVVGATRRKLSEEPLHTPFRHGILHGLNPNFGHPIVAAKALNLVQATIDYFAYLKNEPDRLTQAQQEQTPPQWKELSAQLRRNRALRNALEAWTPRAPQMLNIDSQYDKAALTPNSPELVAAEYLELLKRKNYGRIAAMTVDYLKRPESERAGRFRQELGGLEIQDWSIVSVRDSSAAMSYVGVRTKMVIGKHEEIISSELRMQYANENFEDMVRGMEGGTWYAMPNYTTDLWVLRLRLSDH